MAGRLFEKRLEILEYLAAFQLVSTPATQACQHFSTLPSVAFSISACPELADQLKARPRLAAEAC